MHKRPLDLNESYVLSAKRRVVQINEEATPELKNQQRCRFLNDGYLEALRSRHISDDRYREFFQENPLESISKTLRACFSPTLLKILDECKEDDIDAYVMRLTFPTDH